MKSSVWSNVQSASLNWFVGAVWMIDMRMETKTIMMDDEDDVCETTTILSNRFYSDRTISVLITE